MMGLSWFTQLFHSLVHFILDPRPLNKSHMLIFSKDVYRGTASSLDNILREMHSFLQDGLGRITVQRVEYCKCRKAKRSPWEHEFLIVTVKESTNRGRMAYLMVDRLVDDTKQYPGGQDGLLTDLAQRRDEADTEAADPSSTDESNVEPDPTIEPTTTSSPSTSTSWHSPSRLQRSGAKVKRITKGDAPYALDRLSIFADRNSIKKELGKVKFDVLMTMDLTHSQNPRPMTIEVLTHILQTTSRNTPRYHYLFAQCYWFAYTIWKILEMEMHPQINRHTRHARVCVYSAYPKAVILGKGPSVDTARTPETVKMQWDAERAGRDSEWAALALASQADHRRAEEAEEARRQTAEEGRRQAEEAHRRAEEAEEGRRQAEEAHRQTAEEGRRQAEEAHRRAEEAEEGRRQAEEARRRADAQIRELQAKLEASERHAGSTSVV
ncbi:hypothetical protein EDD18DRAFT_1467508 [Armillaria luteobubalina]|uniref:Uncharacterized protein n=1 Tax=Armillaria luteobubalina TaxID=153913 RepID=A0AA39PI68_9AGAR|nr:hypothetical protein EDD18DRAFT_1467508 [Armillaria luteobubalina]